MKAVVVFTEKEQTTIKAATELQAAHVHMNNMHDICNIDPSGINILNWVKAFKEFRRKCSELDEIEYMEVGSEEL